MMPFEAEFALPDAEPDLRPICFMVMPFNRKRTDEPKRKGAPDEVDCDALWDRAFRPAIEALGYIPVRADYDPGSVIVKDMLERLALADLVLADVSLPNGNVYYEVGLRHVAKETSCVLLAATWSRQLFDIDQFTAIRYTLTEGDVSSAEADAIRDLLVAKVPALKDSRTPYHEFIRGDVTQQKRKGVFRDHMARLSAFQAQVREIRLRERSERPPMVEALRAAFGRTALEIPEVALELLRIVRDELGWFATVEFTASLPRRTRDLPFVREQHLLAVANTGRHEEAIARLEELVREHGDSPERQGLIGGRYKRLWREARQEREETVNGERSEPAKKKKKKRKKKNGRKKGGNAGTPDAAQPSIRELRFLDKAIEHYAAGMRLDLNEYYCSSNLPALLRARAGAGDLEQATLVDHLVIAACTRARELGTADEWLRPTLLGAAFRAGAVDRAAELARDVALEGAAQWKLDTTIEDLAGIVRQTKDKSVRTALAATLDELRGTLK